MAAHECGWEVRGLSTSKVAACMGGDGMQRQSTSTRATRTPGDELRGVSGSTSTAAHMRDNTAKHISWTHRDSGASRQYGSSAHLHHSRPHSHLPTHSGRCSRTGHHRHRHRTPGCCHSHGYLPGCSRLHHIPRHRTLGCSPRRTHRPLRRSYGRRGRMSPCCRSSPRPRRSCRQGGWHTGSCWGRLPVEAGVRTTQFARGGVARPEDGRAGTGRWCMQQTPGWQALANGLSTHQAVQLRPAVGPVPSGLPLQFPYVLPPLATAPPPTHQADQLHPEELVARRGPGCSVTTTTATHQRHHHHPPTRLTRFRGTRTPPLTHPPTRLMRYHPPGPPVSPDHPPTRSRGSPPPPTHQVLEVHHAALA